MNRLLCLGLWVSLSIAMVDGIKCKWCIYRLPRTLCLVPRPPCTLQEGESCYRQTIFFGRKPLYTESGCIRDCEKRLQDNNDLSQLYRCCSDHDFCNA